MIERQLQTAVNNILKWCDTNGHSISGEQELLRALLPQRGLLSLVNTGFTNPGNPSEPSLFSALFLAIPISLFFFSTSGAHFRVSTGGHVPEVPE
ncbi:hypothetical protein TNCV_3610501 [Trichonephila clavipes]|nr:hypothetical protein TNCV_3610501 [Trichonephila clavipes]